MLVPLHPTDVLSTSQGSWWSHSNGDAAQVDKAQRMLHEVRHLEYQSAAVRGACPNLECYVIISRLLPAMLRC